MTPFKALYGRDLPTLLRWEDSPSAVEEVNIAMRERNLILTELKGNLEKAQLYMKEKAYQKRREVEFVVRDYVYLKLRPYKLKSLAKKQNEKLAPRLFGPYKVLEKYGAAACKLELPDTSRIHPVFHVSQLKKSLQPYTPMHEILVSLTEELELQLKPEQVLQARRLTNGKLQVLVQ